MACARTIHWADMHEGIASHSIASPVCTTTTSPTPAIPDSPVVTPTWRAVLVRMSGSRPVRSSSPRLSHTRHT